MDIKVQQQILDQLKKIREENGTERVENQQHRDDMRQDIAGIKSQLHIIQQRLSMAESPVHDVKAFTPPPKGKRVRFEDDDSNGESVHGECIQDNIELLVQDLDPIETTLLDDMLQESCISEDEASSIQNHSKRKDKVRKLALIMSHRNRDKFDKFLKLLKCDHQHIYQKLSESYASKVRADKRPSGCLICVIKRNVNIGHVVDKLISSSIVNMNFYDVFCSTTGPIISQQSNLWEIVFASIDQSRDRREKLKLLQEALSAKYENISAKFNIWQRPRLKCQCRYFVKTSASDSIESNSVEFSTTSDRLSAENRSQSISSEETSVDYSNIPATVQWLQSVDESYSITTTSSDQDYSHLAEPEPLLSDQDALEYGKLGFQVMSDIETPSHNNLDIKTNTGTLEIFHPDKDASFVRQTSNMSLKSIEESLKKRTSDASENRDNEQTDCEKNNPSIVREGSCLNNEKNRKKRNRKKKKKTSNALQVSGYENKEQQNAEKEIPCTTNSVVTTEKVSSSRQCDVILCEMKNIPSKENSVLTSTASPSQITLVNTDNRKYDTKASTGNGAWRTSSNNPEYVTDQEIITPSKSVINNDFKERSNNTTLSSKKRNKKKKI